jgi:Mg-chelatase subunit ChlD
MKFGSLQEKGQTALGPALLASVLLANAGKQGSTVIICTDGLANKGLGSLEADQAAAEAFYL